TNKLYTLYLHDALPISKLNASAISTAIWWIEVQAGIRFTFAGTNIYSNESSIASGLTSAQWAAIQYNAFNDTNQNVFAFNGTDRSEEHTSELRSHLNLV